MNQQKIGELLKELRKQKGMTQEQFAEVFNVSNRTVSRWENGNNMPDIDLLIMISDYYEIDLRELLDGERKCDEMNKEMEETVLKSVEYTNNEAECYTKRVHLMLLIGAACWIIAFVIQQTTLFEITALRALAGFATGMPFGMMIMGIIVTSRYGKKLKAFKERLMKKKY